MLWSAPRDTTAGWPLLKSTRAIFMPFSSIRRGQARIITTYTGAGQNVAFDRAFTEAPANNDEFVILGPLAGGLGRLIATESDGHAHADVKEWLGAAPNVLVSSRVDVSVGAMAADVVTAAAIANAAIDAATFAAGAIDAAAIAFGFPVASLAASKFGSMCITNSSPIVISNGSK